MSQPIEFIDIEFSNGAIWRIAAHDIAHQRAHYYATLDVERGDAHDYENAYCQEYDFAIYDLTELADWLYGNMNWGDVKDKYLLQPPRDFDYAEAFGTEHTNIVKVLRKG